MDKKTFIDMDAGFANGIKQWAGSKKFEQIGLVLAHCTDNIITPVDFLTNKEFEKEVSDEDLKEVAFEQIFLPQMKGSGMPIEMMRMFFEQAVKLGGLRTGLTAWNEEAVLEEIIRAKEKGLNTAIPFHSHTIDVHKQIKLGEVDMKSFRQWNEQGKKINMAIPSGIAKINDINTWRVDDSERCRFLPIRIDGKTL